MTDSRLRIAVLSDIHGNYEAFKSVLADMEEQAISDTICLGDTVGYGPEPEECACLLRERDIVSVMGNHEQGLMGDYYLSWFNPQARDMLLKTRALLSDDSLRWLTSRPKSLVRHGGRFVHGCPPDEVRTYMYKRHDALEELFSTYEENLCFVGHTHELWWYDFDGQKAGRRELEGITVLPGDHRHIINVGAVGQPRDGNPKAKYVIWEPKSGILEVRLVSYDIEKTVQRLADRGFPAAYGKRLGWKT